MDRFQIFNDESFFAEIGRIAFLRGDVRLKLLSAIDTLLATELTDQGYGRVLAADVDVDGLFQRLIAVSEVRGMDESRLADLRRLAGEVRADFELARLVANGSWTYLGGWPKHWYGLFEGERSTPDGFEPGWRTFYVEDLRELRGRLEKALENLGPTTFAVHRLCRIGKREAPRAPTGLRRGLVAHGPLRDVILNALALRIANAVARRDTEHPVFHGGFDWHSAVHGHWALLRVARVTGRHSAEAAAVVESLRREGLAEEDARLARDPSFEMPYGRAWFLRLAIEHDAWCRATNADDPARLAPMAERVATSLLAHCEAHRDGPSTREYASLAWALVQLHDYLTMVDDVPRLARVRALIAEDFIASSAELSLSLDRERPDFFSPFANWAYLIAKTTDAATLGAFLARHPIADADLEPPALLGPAHHLGLPWSRAWAFAALARAAPDAADRSRFALARDVHVAAGLAVLHAQAGDYRAHDHWVPQFAVYALTA